MAKSGVRLSEIGPTSFPDLERLFGANGACGGCWCMWWRVPRGGALWQETRGQPAKEQLRALVESGQALGILAYQGEEPVGWCAFGPRDSFPRTERIGAYRAHPLAGVWSINCFFIARTHRGQRLHRRLLAAAVRACRARGARVVEGYPVTNTRSGGRLPPAFSWTGVLPVFQEAGFAAVEGSAENKPLVRRTLRPGRDRSR